MDKTILAAIIGAFGGIVAAIISAVLGPWIMSKSYRSHNQTPDILGTWENEWYIEDKLYTKDTFEIERWSKNNRFEGTGHEAKGPYRLSGEIDVSRIVVGTYVDTQYPSLGYIGTFILELSIDGKVMEGYWHGRTAKGKIEGGRVVCRRS
jgi:hypothetical protein